MLVNKLAKMETHIRIIYLQVWSLDWSYACRTIDPMPICNALDNVSIYVHEIHNQFRKKAFLTGNLVVCNQLSRPFCVHQFRIQVLQSEGSFHCEGSFWWYNLDNVWNKQIWNSFYLRMYFAVGTSYIIQSFMCCHPILLLLII